MEIKMIGNKIAKARKEINMSQAQLAQHLFISPQAVGKWERGESIPDILTVNRLAEVLGVDLNYFSENFQSTVAGPAVPVSSQNQTPPEVEVQPHSPERQLPINLTAVDLNGTDFAGVVLHNGKFKASFLQGSNFAGADLTGSTFEATDARQASFDNANLTGCNFSVTDLTGASFRGTTMADTTLNMSGQGAIFADVTLTGVKLIKSDLRKTTFERCVFNNVDFSYCDLRGQSFEGQSLLGVNFDKSALNDVSFKGATLKNVSFKLPFSVTNKSYMAMKTICFDGSTMDKLTYAALKGLHVIDLSKVTLL